MPCSLRKVQTRAARGVAYAHFAATAPGGGNASNCLRVVGSGDWVDGNCTASFAYFCERLLP